MRSNTLAVVIAVVIVCSGCKKDDSPVSSTSGAATISCVVRTYGGQAISNAIVQLYAGNTITGNVVATDTSDASGRWQLTTSPGKYTRTIVANGLPMSIVTSSLSSGQNLDTAVLATQTINGIVNDAQTGQPVVGALVRFFSGVGNDTSGYQFADRTTGAQGQWSGSFTLGSYVAAIYAVNRVPLVTNIVASDTMPRQLTTTITQPVAVGQMRIVLNWGAVPSDLDSHLTGDSTSVSGRPRYHVYYNNELVESANGDTIAYLDHDDVTAFGPETITIFKFFPGTLRYKIHDYSNKDVTGSHYMSDSSTAVVRVYTSAGLVREDHIRMGVAGNQWYVYDINGSTHAVAFINTIRDGVSDPADSTFRPSMLPVKHAVKG